MTERAKQLELERDQQAELAAATERARIAREMHDVVAHNVSIMVTLADGAAAVNRTDPVRASEVMREVSATGRTALADMRRLLGVLRPGSDGVERMPQPDLSTIPSLVDRVRATGLNVDFHETGTQFDVPAAVGLTVYRITQESLTNVLKHAADPSHVDVSLSFDRPFVGVSISNDGAPVRGSVEGHGLHGMRERAAVFGAHLDAGPRAQGGWEVVSKIRVDAARINA
jgi:signal transduction histidine kinase